MSHQRRKKKEKSLGEKEKVGKVGGIQFTSGA